MTTNQKRVIGIFGCILLVRLAFAAVKELKQAVAQGLSAGSLMQAIVNSFIDLSELFLSPAGICLIIGLILFYRHYRALPVAKRTGAKPV